MSQTIYGGIAFRLNCAWLWGRIRLVVAMKSAGRRQVTEARPAPGPPKGGAGERQAGIFLLYIFVDWGHVDRGFPDFFRTGGKVREVLQRIAQSVGVQHSHTFVYWPPPYVHNPPTPKDGELRSRHERLKNALRLERDIEFVEEGKVIPIRCAHCHHVVYKQKRVDVRMATDMIRVFFEKRTDPQEAMTYAFLVTGDEDYVPVVSFLRGQNVKIHVSREPRSARALLESVDSWLWLSSLVRSPSSKRR